MSESSTQAVPESPSQQQDTKLKRYRDRPTITLRFWCHHDDTVRLSEEIHQCYHSSPAFSDLVHDAVAVLAKDGEVVIEAKANARKLLRHVVEDLLEQAQADVPQVSNGQWLELSVHPCTGKRVWRQVFRVRAWAYTRVQLVPHQDDTNQLAIVEAWNGSHHEAANTCGVGRRFYPAPSHEYHRTDWHGMMRMLEHREHQAACRQALEDLARRQALAPRHPTGGRSRRRDARQTKLDRLEEQLDCCPGKAPRGLVAMIARERLAAKERAGHIREQAQGVARLERAAA